MRHLFFAAMALAISLSFTPSAHAMDPVIPYLEDMADYKDDNWVIPVTVSHCWFDENSRIVESLSSFHMTVGFFVPRTSHAQLRRADCSAILAGKPMSRGREISQVTPVHNLLA